MFIRRELPYCNDLYPFVCVEPKDAFDSLGQRRHRAGTAMTCHLGSTKFGGASSQQHHNPSESSTKMSEYNIVIFAGEYTRCPNYTSEVSLIFAR